jgi:hypothetical protein
MITALQAKSKSVFVIRAKLANDCSEALLTLEQIILAATEKGKYTCTPALGDLSVVFCLTDSEHAEHRNYIIECLNNCGYAVRKTNDFLHISWEKPATDYYDGGDHNGL